MIVILYILLGLFAGAISGMIGIGGGVIIIPALIYGFGFSQLSAQGTTLALMIPPIGLLAAWTYYKGGYVNLTAAALICAGFFIGGFVGSKLAVFLPPLFIKKIFGSTLLAIALYMIFG
ncbi:MAG: TSUP family transporter [Elusimicrobia bacterium]|nr:TSUP family transporter [Elusimicrobiota bacterium]